MIYIIFSQENTHICPFKKSPQGKIFSTGAGFTTDTPRPKADLLVLKKGNHINGEVKQLEYGVLTFDTDDAGLLSVKWKDVMKLKAMRAYISVLKARDQDVRICFEQVSSLRDPRRVGVSRKILPVARWALAPHLN